MKTLLTLTLCLASMSGSAFAQDAKSECCEQGVAQTAVDKAACAVAATCAKAGNKADCANCQNPGKCADAANCAKAGKKADCAGGSCKMIGMMKGGHGMGLANAKVMVKIMTMDGNGNMVEITPSEMSGGMKWFGRGPSGSSKFDIQKMIEIEVEDMKGNFMFRSDDGDEIHGFHMVPGGEMGWTGRRTGRDGLEKRMIKVEVGGQEGNFIIMGEDGDEEHVFHLRRDDEMGWDGRRTGRGGLEKRMIKVEVGGQKGSFIIMGEDGDEEHVLDLRHDVEMGWDGPHTHEDDLEARLTAIEEQLSRIERMLERMAG